MRTWTNILPLAALAVLFTLAACTEASPGSIIEAEPEAFDTETIYEIVSPTSISSGHSVLLRFDDQEAKRLFAGGMDARFFLEPLAALRAARVRDCRWALDSQARTRVCIFAP
ncbi:MAG: hypothetical protein F4107_12185 [Gemmatimonadetes bacterium]|nr:hypothetical protein [Gemmatimonadota bacterium]MYD13036.1 hypothetical protein [Gemmatimonadota bacterium]MYI66672.1 hypothetical protein [Gemmatimonadota bacterium]